MESSKKHLFSRLYEKVIAPEHHCSGCGACVLVCPFNKLEYINGKPRQISGEESLCPISEEGKCGLCAEVCPRFCSLSVTDDSSKSEKQVFGPYQNIVAAQSTHPALQKKGQDSGLVSGLAAWGLEDDRWTRFLAYSRDELWHPYPVVVTEAGGIIPTSGSKYTYVSLMEGLSKLYEQRSQRRQPLVQGSEADSFAIVGLPCHIAALRKLQQMNSKYVKNLVLCIGLFCSKAFTYQGLVEGKLAEEMRLSVTDIEKMDIRKGRFTVEMKGGDVHEIPLKELGGCAHHGCAACDDFAAEQADISVGGLGIGGWTLAIIRTDSGEEVMEAARTVDAIESTDKDNFPKALGLLEKLSVMKRKNAAKQNQVDQS